MGAAPVLHVGKGEGDLMSSSPTPPTSAAALIDSICMRAISLYIKLLLEIFCRVGRLLI